MECAVSFISPAPSTNSNYSNPFANSTSSCSVPEILLTSDATNTWIMFLVGTIGNALALFFLLRPTCSTSSSTSSSQLHQKKHQVREQFFYSMVTGLALTDMLGILLASPIVISLYSPASASQRGCWDGIGGLPTCHFFSTTMLFAGYATEAIAAVMAAERFVAIRYPLLHRTTHRTNGRTAKLVLAVIWSVSLLLAMLPITGVLGSNQVQWPSTWCFFNSYSSEVSDRLYSAIFVVFGLLCLTVFAGCNTAVVVTLIGNRRRWSQSGSYSERNNSSPKSAEEVKKIKDGATKDSKFKKKERRHSDSESSLPPKVKVKVVKRCQTESELIVDGSGGAAARRRRISRTLLRACSRQNLLQAIDAQTSVFLVVLTCVFCVCWMPLLVQISINSIMSTQCPDYPSNLRVILIASVNQILDPWIYILLRREVLSKLCSLLPLPRKIRSVFINGKKKLLPPPTTHRCRALV